MTARSHSSGPYWPLKVDRSCFPAPAVRLIEKFFQLTPLVSYRHNLHALLSDGQGYPLGQRAMNLHRLLGQKECLGLFALALIYEGFDCRCNLKTARYGLNHFLFEEACKVNLPQLLFVFDKQNIHRLLEQTAPALLKEHQGASEERFDKRAFGFPHERSLQELHRCAIAAMTKQPVLFEKTRNKILTSSVVSTFALPGYPSVDVMEMACAHLLQFKAEMGKKVSLSVSMLEDFLSLLADLAPTWIMGGIQPTAAARELERRLDILLPLLLLEEEMLHANLFKRNLMGRLLANYPCVWLEHEFEAFELLGPNLLEVADRPEPNGRHLIAMHPFIYRQGSSLWYRDALKTLSCTYPDVLNLRHIVREGSRYSAWKPDLTDLHTISDLINALAQRNIFHRLLKTTESAELLNRSNALTAIANYIRSGGATAREIASICLRRFPELGADMVKMLNTPARTTRACAIYQMSTDELMSLRAVCKGAALAHMMRI